MNFLGRLLRRLPRPRLPTHFLPDSTNGQIRTLLAPATSPSAISSVRKRLFAEIMRNGSPSCSMTVVLDNWVEQGHSVEGSFLSTIVIAIRKRRRFTHALQVLEWITKDGNCELTSPQLAVRLDLIAKVRGLKYAREYFEDIPEAMRSCQVYGSLLNCYAYKNSLEEAEFVLQKMRELGFATTLFPYNSLLSAYARARKFPEMDVLVKEMEEKGIEWDNYTYNIRMNAYVAASEFEAMEKLLLKMELDPQVITKWNNFLVPASGFLKSGQIDKALLMLKRVECLAGARFLGKNYLSMLSSLIKLDDMTGAERITEEWEQKRTVYDTRIPNFFITALAERGWFDKAEAYINRLQQIGKEPASSVWYIMSRGYHSGNEMDKAVKALKKALELGLTKWEPNPVLLTACVDYLREQGDDKSAKNLLAYLRNRSSSPGSAEKHPSPIEEPGI
ncbi:hypothetical protein MLD38_003092 [Melastoma candidum]|uniref:Uncharacterized protein n=1 Tax=Melastoma candidum TaxID=119954 RepID=A0ACB9S1L1_9MYRT|nr:hypothetical protein MLD38_003092 [Melastoma candidum]